MAVSAFACASSATAFPSPRFGMVTRVRACGSASPVACDLLGIGGVSSLARDVSAKERGDRGSQIRTAQSSARPRGKAARNADPLGKKPCVLGGVWCGCGAMMVVHAAGYRDGERGSAGPLPGGRRALSSPLQGMQRLSRWAPVWLAVAGMSVHGARLPSSDALLRKKAALQLAAVAGHRAKRAPCGAGHLL